MVQERECWGCEGETISSTRENSRPILPRCLAGSGQEGGCFCVCALYTEPESSREHDVYLIIFLPHGGCHGRPLSRYLLSEQRNHKWLRRPLSGQLLTQTLMTPIAFGHLPCARNCTKHLAREYKGDDLLSPVYKRRN